MDSKKILFITQEITPYLPETQSATVSRFLPQAIQEKGHEIRTFMPKYGTINERRNQLHEVIRLSGMNLIIDDNDHSLIIKVASIQSARMQVYFIDNEDLFQNREVLVDKVGEEYEDNDERGIFFIRGVMETIKKLRWVPDVVHCHGWMSALAPFYIKKGYKDDPCFKNTKVVYSVYNEDFKKSFRDGFAEKLRFDTIGDEEVESVRQRGRMNFETLTKFAVDYSDAVIQGDATINPAIDKHIAKTKRPFLPYNKDFEQYANEVDTFYDSLDGV